MNKIATSQLFSKIKSQATIFGKYLQKQTPENPTKFVRWILAGYTSYHINTELVKIENVVGSKPSDRYMISLGVGIISWYAPYTVCAITTYDCLNNIRNHANQLDLTNTEVKP